MEVRSNPESRSRPVSVISEKYGEQSSDLLCARMVPRTVSLILHEAILLGQSVPNNAQVGTERCSDERDYEGGEAHDEMAV